MGRRGVEPPPLARQVPKTCVYAISPPAQHTYFSIWYHKDMLILLFLISLLWPADISAQSTTDLYQRYLQSAGEYRTSYNLYTTSKNQHSQYKTGATQIEAVNNTNNVLVRRNKLYADYLRYLRSKLADVTNIADYAQTVVYLDLESEISHLDGLSSLGTGNNFAEINSASETWEKRLPASEKLAYATQLQIAATSIAKLQTRVEIKLADFQTQTATPSANQQITLTQINGLLNDVTILRNTTLNNIKNYKNSPFSAEVLFKNLDLARDQLAESAVLLDGLIRTK